MIAPLAAAALAAPLASFDGDAVTTVITDVMVFDAARGTVDGPFDVVLRDGVIDDLYAPGQPRVRGLALVEDGVFVDGDGRTLLPGLVDAHVHLSATIAVPGRLRLPDPADNARAFAFAGVTTVLDLASPVPLIQRLERRIARGSLAGPSVYATGEPFTAPGGHPESSVARMFPNPIGRWAGRHMVRAVVTADDVDEVLAREPLGDGLKVVLDAVPAGGPVISDEALARLSLASEVLERPLFAHVGRVEDAKRALDFGVDALVHAPYDAPLPAGDVQRLADLGVGFSPTLGVWEAVRDLGSGASRVDPLARDVLTARQERDVTAPLAHAPEDPEMWAWVAGVHPSVAAESLYAVWEAGGRPLLGSDSPFLTSPGGAGTHREIDAWVDAGLPMAEVLSLATAHAAAFLDPKGRFGRVLPGWQADLLLVDGNPLSDPAAIHRVAEVWIDGRRVVRRPR